MGHITGHIQTWQGNGKEAWGKSWLSLCFHKDSSRPPWRMSFGVSFPPTTGKDVLLGAPHLLSDMLSACKGVQNE